MRYAAPSVSPAKVDESDSRGWIVAVGGNEEKTGDREILRRFLDLCGGDDARIAILPTASSQADTGARYQRLFTDLGARRADVLPYAERRDADDGEHLRSLEKATGIFLTGGNQLRI